MRLGVLDERAVLLHGDQMADIALASAGRFGPDPMQLYAQWDEFREWERNAEVSNARRPLRERDLACPVPRPGQIFAVGLNYAEHAAETRYEVPAFPPVFTKFRSALAGPYSEVRLPSGNVDWEVELVVVIGRTAHRISERDGWDHVAGLTIGQDLSERVVQFEAHPPQFSIGKSFPGFAPIGPVVVTPDEFANHDDLAIRCEINGECMQQARTSQMLFSVPELLVRLSAVVTLSPGDLIFTGTPAGVGMAREPQRWLQPGDVLRSHIEGIGEMEQRCVAG